jgi:RecA-family ATPase
MNIDDILPPLTGDKLMEALKKSDGKRDFIADGFLYEQTILMMAAEPGLGKSTISIQAAIELAAGLPLFGVFEVPRPMKVLYIQTERPVLESLERIEIISKTLPVVKENLHITDTYQIFNVLDPKHAEVFINCVKRDCPDVDVIFCDPIYAMVSGGLKDDVPASAFTKTMSALQRETGATLWYNHHTKRETYSSSGDRIKVSDPFYGSQWIKANVTSSYHMTKGINGVRLIKKKDNYNLLSNQLDFDYDPETSLSTLPVDALPAIEKLKNYLRIKEIDQKTFSFKDMEEATKISTRRVRELILHSPIKEKLNVVSSKRNKNLYQVVPLHKHTD